MSLTERKSVGKKRQFFRIIMPSNIALALSVMVGRTELIASAQ